MRICTYNPEQRYVIRAPVGFPVNLHFGATEQAKRSDFAYTGVDKDEKPVQTWKAPDTVRGSSGNAAGPARYQTNLPIWAFQEGHSSVVITTMLADGSERPYHFDLIALPADAKDVNVTSDLTFVYPAEKAAAAKKEAVEQHQAAVAAWLARQTKAKEQLAIERLKVDVFYGPQNKNYMAAGETKYKWLAPKSISDNGFLTQMQWPDNVQIPTIAVIDPVTGDPRTLTPTMQGQMVIIPMTAARFRLWLGHDAVLDIKNNAWRPDRLDPRTGTPSPEVVRTVNVADGR